MFSGKHYIETPFEPFVQISINNVTDMKRTQVQIEKSNKRLEALLKISQLSSENLTDLFDFSFGVALDLTDSKFGFIYIYDEQNIIFKLNHSKDDAQASIANKLPKSFTSNY